MPSKLPVAMSIQKLYNDGVDKNTSIFLQNNAIRSHYTHENQAFHRAKGDQGRFMPV